MRTFHTESVLIGAALLLPLVAHAQEEPVEAEDVELQPSGDEQAEPAPAPAAAPGRTRRGPAGPASRARRWSSRTRSFPTPRPDDQYSVT